MRQAYHRSVQTSPVPRGQRELMPERAHRARPITRPATTHRATQTTRARAMTAVLHPASLQSEGDELRHPSPPVCSTAPCGIPVYAGSEPGWLERNLPRPARSTQRHGSSAVLAHPFARLLQAAAATTDPADRLTRHGQDAVGRQHRQRRLGLRQRRRTSDSRTDPAPRRARSVRCRMSGTSPSAASLGHRLPRLLDRVGDRAHEAIDQLALLLTRDRLRKLHLNLLRKHLARRRNVAHDALRTERIARSMSSVGSSGTPSAHTAAR